MKLIYLCVLFFLIFTTSLSINLNRKVSRSHSKDAESDAMKNYIDSLAILEIPGYISTKKEVDGNTPITSIANNLQPNQLRALDWVKVKKHFSDTDLGITYMTRFLHLRMKDVLMMTSHVFALRGFSTTGQVPTSQLYEGAYSYFSTPTVRVNIGNTELVGKYWYRSGGSQSLTSDIDFSVDFKGGSSNSYTIYQRLVAMARFIGYYNVEFEALHAGATSLKTYDVNLYSADFGNKDLLVEVTKLKTDAVRWGNFVAANRYSQLHIIYYDALEKFHEKISTVVVADVRGNDVLGKLADVLRKSQPSHNTKPLSGEKCGEYLFQLETGVLGANSARGTVSDPLRNKAMVFHVEKAGQSGQMGTASSNIADALCHVLAANFQALEAYVSVGSIVDMLTIQGTLTENNELDDNGRIDSALMNFGYAVEHYYEAVGVDNLGAIKKISKYLARLYQASQKLSATHSTHKQCWAQALSELSPVSTQNLKDMIADFNTKFTTIFNANDNEKRNFQTSYSMFKKGYGCVLQHAFNL